MLVFAEAGAALGVETRSIESYAVDPLTEPRRWQRNRVLEIGDIVLADVAPNGSLGIVSDPNELRVYDGYRSESILIPEELEVDPINGFAISSDGTYCLVTGKAILLYDGSAWLKVADVGLGELALDNVIETGNGILWAGTDAGIARIDPVAGTCEITPSPHRVISLAEGPFRKSIWISYAASGEVWECPIEEDRLLGRENWMARAGPLGSEVLATSLLRASDGRIWYINNHLNLPLLVFAPEIGEWEAINLSEIGGDNFDFSILETPNGNIWISSRGSLHVLQNGEWEVYHSPEFPLPGGRSILLEDKSGHILVIETSGMNVQIDHRQGQGLSFRNLHYQDETRDGGLLFLSVDDEVVEWTKGAASARFHSAAETGLSSPTALHVHSDGHWFLTGSNNQKAGVSIFNGEAWRLYEFPDVGLSFGHLALLERPNGDVWLGCAQLEMEFPGFEGGIVVFRPDADAGGGYSINYLRPPAFSYRNWSLQTSGDGPVYTSGNGLFQNTPEGAVTIDLPEPIRYKWIDQVVVDSNGTLWCAIWSMGLYRFQDNTWTRFTEEDGLGNNLTSFVLCLEDQFPVVFTTEGQFRFDGHNWAPYMGNLGGLHRGSGRAVEADDGSVWINHTHVDWYYRGQRAEPYADEKKRGFRSVQYIPDRRPPDTQWASEPPELLRETNLRFAWRGVDAWSNTSPEEIQFSYRIDGGEWSPFMLSNELELDEMKGGRHVIEVRSRDTDFNVDPTPLRAEFTVILPLWKQPWFIASILAALVFFSVIVFLFIRQRIRHLIEIEQVKMRFFTHISHEIKTPLSLIMGPVERLQNETRDTRHQHYLSLIKSNSQRLLFLVNQLLDFRKFQLKQLDFKPVQGDFIPFARSCLAVFEGWIREKRQRLRFEPNVDSFVFFFDQDMFHKIIDNLVNNAIKYTPEGGEIVVRINRVPGSGGPGHGEIVVEDQGIGIRQSDKENIFEPFYRGKVQDDQEEGTGIGLAFVKELVGELQGRIEVESPLYPEDREYPGTRFKISFPVKGACTGSSGNAGQSAKTAGLTGTTEEAHTAPPDGDLILLIEDNKDLREFLGAELSEAFRMEAAESAEEGISLASRLVPDLIISDIVLPGKDGFELCRTIKQQTLTSHIPVLLLTALRSEEHRLKAYESGADDFITKPVSPELLRLKVKNLIRTQKRSRELVRQQFVEENRITGLSPADQAFLDKADEIVERELSNEQFEVNSLAGHMGFSRSSFYRKFNSLIDLSPASFIKSKRLSRAARLLVESGKSVSEIAFDVGFSDSGYFSRVFKDKYKCSPSEFAKKNR